MYLEHEPSGKTLDSYLMSPGLEMCSKRTSLLERLLVHSDTMVRICGIHSGDTNVVKGRKLGFEQRSNEREDVALWQRKKLAGST